MWCRRALACHTRSIAAPAPTPSVYKWHLRDEHVIAGARPTTLAHVGVEHDELSVRRCGRKRRIFIRTVRIHVVMTQESQIAAISTAEANAAMHSRRGID